MGSRSSYFIASCVSAALLAGVGSALAQVKPAAPARPAADPKAAAFFETKIRPLLARECFACHNEKNTKGGLRLDTPQAFFRGGDTGKVVTPGHPEMSLLIQAVNYNKEGFKMPPSGKLKPQQIADLTAWVKMGAPWPNFQAEVTSPALPGGPLFTPEQKKFWSFQPVRDPVVPTVRSRAWVVSPIDAFVLQKLEAKGLKPAPKADRRTLIRRVTFDLTGLPPTPEEVDAFLKDTSPGAWEKVIDRLLASPAYGERWGRHWLDIARYADSNGLDENTAFANAWRYRDYVVKSLNDDKPYDQFVREQIAGDLLPGSDDPAVNAERLTATGYLVLGPKVLAEPDKQKMVMDIVDEQIDTVGKSILGLTLGCARCHDHKFDPLPTRDYYGLAGIFKSTRTMESLATVAKAYERPISDPGTVEKNQAYREKLAGVQESLRRAQNQANADASGAVVAKLDRYLLAGLEADVRPPAAGGPDLTRPGAVVVEAEQFKKADVLVNLETYGVGIGIIESAGRTAAFTEYEVAVPVPGEFEILVRYASGQARPVKISLDGRVLKSDAAKRETGGFNPQNQVWEVVAVRSLAAGKHVMRLDQAASALPHVDKFAFLPPPPRSPASPQARPRTSRVTDLAAAQGLDPETLRRSAVFLLPSRAADPIWAPWSLLAALPDAGFAEAARKLTAEWRNSDWNPLVAQAFAGPAPQSLAEAAQRYQKLFARANDAWNRQVATAKKPPTRLGDANLEALRQVLYRASGPFGLDAAERLYPPPVVAAVGAQRAMLAELQKSAPAPAAMVLSVEDARDAGDVKVHIRGNHLTLGEEAPRIFPRIIAGERQEEVVSGSGRLEFAGWLTRPDNPLTARVMVNRIWYHHFGEGIVRTTDNFGKLGDRPSHPELLDWLTKRFIEKGWSLKAMHRLLLTSNTYQQSTTHDARAALADPENRLLWRFHRRRLEVEAIRDSMLAVAGQLDRTMGGTLLKTPNFGYVTNDQSANAAQYDSDRRSLYLPVIRNAVFDVFQVFDFVEPSFPNGNRSVTTVAPQALFLMNGAFVQEQAEAFAKALLTQPGSDSDRIRAAYLRAFARPATEVDLREGEAYLKAYATALAASEPDPEKRSLATWRSFAQILFASNEFVVVN